MYVNNGFALTCLYADKKYGLIESVSRKAVIILGDGSYCIPGEATMEQTDPFPPRGILVDPTHVRLVPYQCVIVLSLLSADFSLQPHSWPATTFTAEEKL